MTEYTPGPWRITPRKYDGTGRPTHDYTISRDGEFIAAANEANARLIAAAPDLLEAAQRAVSPVPAGAMTQDELDTRRSLLEAAIAKATGETP